MPQLIFHGIEPDTVRTCSTELVQQLATVMQTEVDNFLLEVVHSVQIIEPSYPYIDVRWFDRGQDIQDRSAVIITNAFKDLGISPLDIIFIPLEKNSYYENAEHF